MEDVLLIMQDKLSKLKIFLWKASLLLFIALSGYVVFCGVFFWDGLDACYEKKDTLLRGAQMMLALFSLGCIWLFLYRLTRRLGDRTVKLLSVMLLILIPMLQLFYLLHEPCLLRYDALKVYDEALSMLSDGNISAQVFDGYFARYTNNYGITIFAYLILKVASIFHILADDYHNGLLILQIVNLIFTDLAFYLGWLLLRHCAGLFLADPGQLSDPIDPDLDKTVFVRTTSDKSAIVGTNLNKPALNSRGAEERAGLLYLLFILLSPLSYVWLPFFYTNSISMVFAMGTIYTFYEIFVKKSRNPLLSLGSGFLIVIGFSIRATQVIICIAALLYLLLTAGFQSPKKHAACRAEDSATRQSPTGSMQRRHDAQAQKQPWKNRHLYLSCVLLLFGMCIALGGCKILSGKYTISDPDAKFPAVHWIAMGLNTASGGTFDTLDELYTMQYPTAAEKKEADMLLLKERLQELGINGVCRLYFDKLRLTFSDGTSAYPTELSISDRYDDWYQNVYGNNRFYLQYYCQLTYLLALCFCVCGAWTMIRKKETFGSPAYCIYIALLGAFLFHMIWEAGTIYSIGFTFLVYAGFGFAMAFRMPAAAQDVCSIPTLFSRQTKCTPDTLSPATVPDTLSPTTVPDTLSPATVQDTSADEQVLPAAKVHTYAALRILIPSATVLVCICSLTWIIYDYSHFEQDRRVALSVNQYLFLSDHYEPCESGMKLKQTFEAERDFDEIYLQTGDNFDGNDSVYQISLCDQNGEVIDSCTLAASDIAYPHSLTGLSLHSRPRNNSYLLTIEKIAGEDNLTFLYYDTGNYDAYKKGSLAGLPDSKKADLCFIVLKVL